jgi:cell division protein FtsI/penicillin-binding protein 2
VKGEKWYIGDTYHAAIGQGDILVTPLQIAVMTATIANHGTFVRPRVVSAFTSIDGTRVEKQPEVANPQVVDKQYVDVIRKGMRQTVTSGSARSLNALPVAVAGKTGTAQWNSKKANQAWFTSFAPYDKPEIVVTIMVEEGGEGSRVASPIARAIYQRYFQGIMPKALMPAPAITDTPAEPTAPVEPGLDPIGTAQP